MPKAKRKSKAKIIWENDKVVTERKNGFGDKSAEIREEITTRIITALESGKLPWHKPWLNINDPNCGLPTSISTSKVYRGVNTWLLEIEAILRGYTCKWWGTYHCWNAIGGQVRKGEKGTRIVLLKRLEKDDPKKTNEDGTPKKKFLSWLTGFTVFNFDQIEDKNGKLKKYAPTPEKPGTVRLDPDFKDADLIFDATKAKIIYGGNRAYYHLPSGAEYPMHTEGHFIQMPTRNRFPDQRDFHDTRFHELVHWTKPELKRNFSYAFEEIVAELGCVYLSRAAKIPQNEDLTNHVAYVQSWLKEMKEDPKWIFRAATESNKAADYLLGFSKKVDSNESGDGDK